MSPGLQELGAPGVLQSSLGLPSFDSWSQSGNLGAQGSDPAERFRYLYDEDELADWTRGSWRRPRPPRRPTSSQQLLRELRGDQPREMARLLEEQSS